MASAADGEAEEPPPPAQFSPAQFSLVVVALIVGIAVGAISTFLALGRAGSAGCSGLIGSAGSSTARDRMPYALVDWLLEPIDALEAKYGTLSEVANALEHAPPPAAALSSCRALLHRIACGV